MKSAIMLFIFFLHAGFLLSLHAEKMPFKKGPSLSSPITDTLTWKFLNQLEYKEKDHEIYGKVYLPEFSNAILKMAGKEIIIKGYIIPVDNKNYALSKNVYAACFFCGKAGPETVMGLQFKKDPGRIKMDSHATIKGRFIINATDVENWMYLLDDVEILSIREK